MTGRPSGPPPEKIAFVLSGGGPLGATQVGMLHALLEHEILPDLILGTSVGSVNGAAVAAEPSAAAVERLAETWQRRESSGLFAGSVLTRVGTLARSRTHLHGDEALREALEANLPVRLIEELAVPFECVAASIERASEHWFTAGPIVDAVLASCAVPGLLPPVEIDGEHFLDGGLVNSIPVGRAVELGATTIYVLQVGRVDAPLRPPRWPWEVGLVAFEIARRHRFVGELAAVEEQVEVHVLPTGQQSPPRYGDLSQSLYRDRARIGAQISLAYEASGRYLGGQAVGER